MVSATEVRAVSANNCVLPDKVEEYVSNKILAAANNGEFSTSVCFSWDMWKSKYSTYAKIAARMLKKEGYSTLLYNYSGCTQCDLDISWDNM